MIEQVIGLINKELQDLFGNYPGLKVYEGIARVMTVKKADGSTTGMPAVVDRTGEGKYTGIDDTAPLIFYHKNNSLQLGLKPNSGYGDERAEIVDTYNNSLIVYINRSKVKVNPDEIHLYIQARLPWKLPIPNFKSVRITFQSVNLNGQTVYQTEYPGKLLSPAAAMVSINYQIESTFSKNCFAVCPMPVKSNSLML